MKEAAMNEPTEVTYWRSQGFGPKACEELARLKIGSWGDLKAYLQEVLTVEEERSLAVAIIHAACRYLDMEDETRRRKKEDFGALFSEYVLRRAT